MYDSGVRELAIYKHFCLHQDYSEIARGLSLPDRTTIASWCDRYRDTGEVDGRRTERGRPERVVTPEVLDWIEAEIDAECDVSLKEMKDEIELSFGVVLDVSTVCRHVLAANYTVKIKHRPAAQRKYVQIGEFYERMREWKAAGVDARSLVFIDEMSRNVAKMQRRRGRAKRGERATKAEFLVRGQRFNVMAALAVDGFIAVEVTTDNGNEETYERFWVDHLLGNMNPYPAERSIVIMDNAAIHGSENVVRWLHEQGTIAQRLAPYCPHTNPIELAFAWVTARMAREQNVLNRIDRNDHARIIGFIEDIFWSMPAAEAQSFFEHYAGWAFE